MTYKNFAVDDLGYMNIEIYKYDMVKFCMVADAWQLAKKREEHADLAMECELRLEGMAINGKEWPQC